MGTKNTVWLVSGGTSYYLSGGGSGQTAYAGSGTPWTAESTTPYELSLNDAVPIWVPTPAPATVLYSGGPPFANGRRPVYRSYDNVTEQVGVQLRATTKDNAIALLRQLRQVLNTAQYSVPCVLAVTGGTNTGYTEIYSADVPETPSYIIEPDGIFRATITWTRTPFFGVSSLTTLINGTSFTNNGTNNVASLGALTGDLIYEGQPLNIKVAESNTPFGGRNFYLSTYDTHTKTTVNNAAGPTTGSASFTDSTLSVDNIQTNARLKLRVMARFTTLTNPGKMQFRATVLTEGQGLVGRTGWIGPNSSWTTPFLDFGGFDLGLIRSPLATTAKVVLSFEVRSSDGTTSVTATLNYNEILLYYDFARVVMNAAVGSTSFYQQLVAAGAVSGGGWLPAIPRAYTADAATDRVYEAGVVRGTAPGAYSGASLFLAWTDANDVHTTTAAAAVTAKLAPLYTTLRGAG